MLRPPSIFKVICIIKLLKSRSGLSGAKPNACSELSLTANSSDDRDQLVRRPDAGASHAVEDPPRIGGQALRDGSPSLQTLAPENILNYLDAKDIFAIILCHWDNYNQILQGERGDWVTNLNLLARVRNYRASQLSRRSLSGGARPGDRDLRVDLRTLSSRFWRGFVVRARPGG